MPVLGFGVLPSFMGEGIETFDVDLGPISNFPQGEYVIATYLESPDQGEVSRRTAFIRNNGRTDDGVPSFTALFSRCVHLGCPVQPNGPIDEEAMKEVNGVELRPVLAASFGCPCHGGLYDSEGNRNAGPPVRSLDRYEFSIKDGNLVLGRIFSVGNGRRHRREGADREVLQGVSRRPRGRPREVPLPDPDTREQGVGMAVKSTRRQQLETVALYPLDWVEERSGLVGYTKWFLFRKVPRDISWAQTLGAAALTAFIVQTLTGVFLAMYYHPNPDTAYASVVNITEEVTLGWLVRGMHKWGASVFIILMFFHMARTFLFGAYKYPRELNWIIGVLLLVLGMLEGFTGYLLPWDQTAYWATVVGINLNATAPFAGPFLAQFLQGGLNIGPDTLSKFYALHMLLVPGAIFALIGLHLYLVVRLGVTSPPWSKSAAGRVRPETNGGGREGLIRAPAEPTGDSES